MRSARRHGVVVSYDLNYRPSIWKASGGRAAAQEVNRRIVDLVDVLLGNEEDFTACLGIAVPGADARLEELDPESFKRMIETVVGHYPRLAVAATTLRTVRSASTNDWGGWPGRAMPASWRRRTVAGWMSSTGSAGATRSRPG